MWHCAPSCLTVLLRAGTAVSSPLPSLKQQKKKWVFYWSSVLIKIGWKGLSGAHGSKWVVCSKKPVQMKMLLCNSWMCSASSHSSSLLFQACLATALVCCFHSSFPPEPSMTCDNILFCLILIHWLYVFTQSIIWQYFLLDCAVIWPLGSRWVHPGCHR